MSVVHKMKTSDGGTIDLTLNLGALFELSKQDKSLTDRYFELQKKDQNKLNEFDLGEFLYIAYRAAHINEECMTLEQFLYSLPDSRQEMSDVFIKLYGQEKKQAFPRPSGRRHDKK